MYDMVKIGCLQNTTKNLGSVLYEDSDFTDVTLVCGDGQRVKCHRSVLASSSVFLRRLLFESEQQQTFLFLGARVAMEEVRALLQLIYLGTSLVPQTKLAAIAALEQDLQILEKFQVGDFSGLGFSPQEIVLAEGQDLEVCQPELQEKSELVEVPESQSQMVILPEKDLNDEGATPKENIEKEKPKKYEKMLKIEKFETCEGDNLSGLFPVNQVKSEEIRVKKRRFQPKKFPQVYIRPPDRFGDYSCEQCEYKNGDKHKLKYHVLIKHEGVSYDCDQCQSKFSRSDTLAIHVRRNHENESKLLFKCESCGKNLETMKGMKSHSVEQKCTKCEFISCRTSIQTHMKTAHNPYFHNDCFSCDKCTFRTEKYKKMNSHVRENHTKASINCNQCTFKTNRKRHLRAHVIDQHDGSQTSQGQNCELCQKLFRARRPYLRHMKRQHGEKRILCESCDYKASSPYNLIEHKRIKHEFIKYKCQECEAEFNFKGSLKKHNGNVHNGKVFQCEKCDMRFSSLGNLRRHRRNNCAGEEEDDKTPICTARDCCRNIQKQRTEENHD